MKMNIYYIPFPWMEFRIMISVGGESIADLSNRTWLIVFAKTNNRNLLYLNYLIQYIEYSTENATLSNRYSVSVIEICV